ncbi:MAG: hypothetical protein U0270_07310 [Labilithrix sp.]
MRALLLVSSLAFATVACSSNHETAERGASALEPTSCGAPKRLPSRADVRMIVPSFYEVPMGAFVQPGTFVSSSVWATGEATRLSSAVTALTSQTSDEPALDLEAKLMGPRTPAASVPGTYSNRAAPVLGLIDPSSEVLSFSEGFGQREAAWSMPSPRRTPLASSVGMDLFVRGLVPGRFFAFQIAVVLAPCAIGALSEIERRPAVFTDGTHATGLLDPANLAEVERVLLQTDAKLFVRVIANKANATASELLSSTACSTGDMAACRTLIDDLAVLSRSLVSAPPSDLSKLETGSDPSWSTVAYTAAPVAILEP